MIWYSLLWLWVYLDRHSEKERQKTERVRHETGREKEARQKPTFLLSFSVPFSFLNIEMRPWFSKHMFKG